MQTRTAQLGTGVDFFPSGTRQAPADVHLAHRLFSANCGPASLAAVLSVQVCDVITLFDQFPDHPYTTRKKMEEVLRGCGLEFVLTEDFPDFGLALIQFEGRWSRLAGSERWAGKYSHWTGVSGAQIYDINADEWTDRAEWESTMIPILLAEYPGASGWRLKRGLRILPQDFSPGDVLPGFHFARGSCAR